MGEKTLFSQKCKKCENPEKPVNFSYFSCFWAHLEACDQAHPPPEPQKIHIRQRFCVWSLCELGFQFISLKPPFCHPLTPPYDVTHNLRLPSEERAPLQWAVLRSGSYPTLNWLSKHKHTPPYNLTHFISQPPSSLSRKEVWEQNTPSHGLHSVQGVTPL